MCPQQYLAALGPCDNGKFLFRTRRVSLLGKYILLKLPLDNWRCKKREAVTERQKNKVLLMMIRTTEVRILREASCVEFSPRVLRLYPTVQKTCPPGSPAMG